MLEPRATSPLPGRGGSERAWWLVAAALILGRGSIAFAQQAPPVRLDYRVEPGIPGCPMEAELQDAVSARLGYVPFLAEATRSVVASIARQRAGLRGLVQLVTSPGLIEAEQEIVTERLDCDTLAASMARSIANAVDPRLFLSPRPIRPAGPAEPEPQPPAPAPRARPAHAEEEPARPARVPPPVPANHAPVTERQDPWRPVVGGALLVAVGAGPGVAASGSVAVALASGAWAVGLEVRADGPSWEDGGHEGRVGMWQLMPTLAACRRLWWVDGCGLVAMGLLHAWGEGTDVTRERVLFHAAAGSRIALGIPAGPRWRLRVQADLLVPLTPTDLKLDGEVVWTMPSVSGAIGLGLQWILS